MGPRAVQAWQVLQDEVTGRAAGEEQRLHSEWQVVPCIPDVFDPRSLKLQRTCNNTNFGTSKQCRDMKDNKVQLDVGHDAKTAVSLLQG